MDHVFRTSGAGSLNNSESRKVEATSERWFVGRSIVGGIACGFILPYGLFALVTIIFSLFRGPVVGHGEWGRTVNANDHLVGTAIAGTMLALALITLICLTYSIAKSTRYRRFWIGFVVPAHFICITAAMSALSRYAVR